MAWLYRAFASSQYEPYLKGSTQAHSSLSSCLNSTKVATLCLYQRKLLPMAIDTMLSLSKAIVHVAAHGVQG